MPRLSDLPEPIGPDCAGCGKPVSLDEAVSDNDDDAPYHPDCLAERLASFADRAIDAAEDRALGPNDPDRDPDPTP